MLSRCRLGATQPKTRRVTKLIDRIRHDIQQRLDQLLAEADKLRHALAALDPRERSARKPKTTKSQPTATRAATPDAAEADLRSDPNAHCQQGERRERGDANGAR